VSIYSEIRQRIKSAGGLGRMPILYPGQATSIEAKNSSIKETFSISRGPEWEAN